MDDRMRILLCEDDENLGMLLREYLQAKGFNADLYADGEAGYKAFLKGKYDICVLDVMMPKKDGFTLAQEIRAVNSEVPIIFLTAKTIKEDILEGFKIGADDYITKPFSMEELVFRIEAILRRVKGKKGKEVTMYKIGRFTFDTQKQVLMIDDKVTKLTTKESELLSLLCAHVNEILERNYALKTIWIDLRLKSSTSTAKATSSSPPIPTNNKFSGILSTQRRLLLINGSRRCVLAYILRLFPILKI